MDREEQEANRLARYLEGEDAEVDLAEAETVGLILDARGPDALPPATLDRAWDRIADSRAATQETAAETVGPGPRRLRRRLALLTAAASIAVAMPLAALWHAGDSEGPVVRGPTLSERRDALDALTATDRPTDDRLAALQRLADLERARLVDSLERGT